METERPSDLGERLYFAAALAGKLYLEKFRPDKNTVRKISSGIKVMRRRAGALDTPLMKEALSEKELIGELLNLTGNGSSLEEVAPESSVKTLAGAIFRELLQQQQHEPQKGAGGAGGESFS